MTTEVCGTCRETTSTGRYCAPARCYCGHRSCPAFASWVDMSRIGFADSDVTGAQHAKSWNDREGASWIDKL